MTKLNNFNPQTRATFSLSALAKSLFATIVLTLGLFAQSTSAAAETTGYINYVTDSVEIPLRRGAGYKYKIAIMLKSGTPVKIIEVNSDGWAQVEYTRGSKLYAGWMPSSVLQNQPIASVRLESQMEKTNRVEEKYNALQQELNTLKDRFQATNKALSSIKQEKFEVVQQLNRLKSLSSNAVQLDEQNQAMKLRLNQLDSQNALMKEQIDQSNDSIKRQWFLTGGGVLLLGLLLGRFFRTPGKRKKWGEL